MRTGRKVPIGVMQGRLLPKFENKFQAHPIGQWQQEFFLAKELGLDCIEFIYEFDRLELNPLNSVSGRREIQFLTAYTGIKVLSVCADFFMKLPLHSTDKIESRKSLATLLDLIEVCGELDVPNIIVPCVDDASLVKVESQLRLIKALTIASTKAEDMNVKLSLETDLSAKNFRNLLDQLPSSAITVNYDMGNSASMGFDPVDEFASYGERIGTVHVKDRLHRGGSVFLGSGDTDIRAVIALLKASDFSGPLIMQAFRGNDNGLESFLPQYRYLVSILERVT